jgi:flagellar hook-associated protein 3 FlgL
MRVSTIGLTHQTLAGIQRAAAALEEATVKTQTGLRIARPSDDPHGASSIMTTSSALRALEQYGRNVNAATARLNMEEDALSQLTTALERAKQLAMQEAGGSANATTRSVAKAEIDQLLSFAIQLANTRHEGEYLFGGDQATTPPITSSTAPFTATPITGQRTAQIAEGQYVTVTHNATDIFLNTNVLATLEQVSTALAANDPVAITAAISSIDGAHASLQDLIGEVGARSQQLGIAASNLQALDSTLQAFRADIQELDLEEAVTHLVARQNAYQAALLTTSRVMNLSLADYMR